MDPRYSTLVQILDRIAKEAPENDKYKLYRPSKSKEEAVTLMRSRAYIHLYLWVKFGLLDFVDRESLITDGQFDGGLDAYYIDESRRCIYLIQSKFRATSDNFANKLIWADDLVKMDIGRISRGNETDSSGNPFNERVKRFQQRVRELNAVALYDWRVIILANLTKYNKEQVRKLLDGFNFEVLNFQRAYSELVFPVCSGTYYDPQSIEIRISLSRKEHPNLKQKIDTRFGVCDVMVTYVPTAEIGRLMLEYKNAMLRYNPRNYLSLSKNRVNRGIRESIVGLGTNDFAIMNNGITMLADRVAVTTITGNEDEGQLVLTRPQIINGGQTAYTLSHIYETEYSENPKIFDDKEVMLKVVTLQTGSDPSQLNDRKREFIDMISDATNRQSKVTEADRRSNSDTLMNIQSNIFSTYGFFFQRKEGEFFDGRSRKLIDKEFILEREDLFRAYLSYKGDPARAYSSGEDKLFEEDNFMSVLADGDDYRKMFFAARLHGRLERIEKEMKNKSRRRYGNGLRFGKFAVICAVGQMRYNVPKTSKEVDVIVVEALKKVLPKWKSFETYAMKQPGNTEYFRRGVKEFQNYYKGKTINHDLESFFDTRYG